MFCRLFNVLKSNFRHNSSYPLNWVISECPELDVKYFYNKNNLQEIDQNIQLRKGVGDIKKVIKLKQLVDNGTDPTQNISLHENLLQELLKLPNRTHPDVINYGDDPKVLRKVNNKRKFDFKELEFHEITKRLNLVRSEHLGNLSGSKSYYILGEMVELEQALVNYFSQKLYQSGFELISVPDILNRKVIESCGMNTRGTRTQVIRNILIRKKKINLSHYRFTH